MEKNKEQIPAGAVYQIEVEDKVCYLKEPDRATTEIVLGLVANPYKEPQFLRAGEIVLLKCWVGGDMEIQKDEKYLLPAAQRALNIVEVKQAKLKKL